MYEYKSVSVPIENKMFFKKGEYYQKCMNKVQQYAKEGWRLVQIVIPINEETGVVNILPPYGYEIIFEKEV